MRDALELLLSDANCGDESLKYQIDFARVQKREHTGVGVFVDLEIPDQLAVADKAQRVVSNLSGEMDCLTNGFGGVLFIDGGKIQMLEFFTYDEPWPADTNDYSFRLTGSELRSGAWGRPRPNVPPSLGLKTFRS